LTLILANEGDVDGYIIAECLETFTTFETCIVLVKAVDFTFYKGFEFEDVIFN
jgi:hypothetical protein